MDLNELLRKTKNKVDTSKESKIQKVSIAKDDRPYDELIAQNNKEDLINKESKITKKSASKTKKQTPEETTKFSQNEIISDRKDIEGKTVEKSMPGREGGVDAKPEDAKSAIVSKKEQTSKSSISGKTDIDPPIQVNLNDLPSVQEQLLEEPRVLFLKLAGFERKVVNYFFEITKKNNAMQIGPISRDLICSTLDININTLKRTLRKLKDKRIILTVYHKTGKGGWAIYEFNQSFYQELISSERIQYTVFNESSDNSESLSSREIAITRNGLPKEWDNLDYEDLYEKGFTKNHLIQIYQDQQKRGEEILDFAVMQHSLDAFRFDLENNLSILKDKSHTKSPVMFFTQILSKGRPYNSFTPEKFKTPKQIEFQKYKHKIEQIHTEYEGLKDKFFDLEYQAWYQGLSEDDLARIYQQQNLKIKEIPSNILKVFKTKACRTYFEDYIWIDIQKSLHSKFYS